MKTYISILGIFLSLGITAQTTSIPDPVFEQHLIDEGIDNIYFLLLHNTGFRF